MKKLITYLIIFLVAISSKSFAQKVPGDVKPLSKGIYSAKGKKEFRQEEREKRHVFKLWKKVFDRKKPSASVAVVRSNAHFAKETKNEQHAKRMAHKREMKEFKKGQHKINTKPTIHLKRRRKTHQGEK